LIAWAGKMGLDDAAGILAETLEEEKATDENLSELAESEINVEASEKEDDEEAPKRASGGRRR
jgi:ferritin-like metal-binding protein YciE